MKLFFYQFNCRQNTRFKPPCLVIKCSFFKMSVVFNLNLVSGRVQVFSHTILEQESHSFNAVPDERLYSLKFPFFSWKNDYKVYVKLCFYLFDV